MQRPLEFDAQQVDATPWYSLGWGGVMLTFLILAHTVDATQLMGLGWGGSGSDSWYLRRWRLEDGLWKLLKAFVPARIRTRDLRDRRICRQVLHRVKSFMWSRKQWSETVDSVGCTGPKNFLKGKTRKIANIASKKLIYVALPCKYWKKMVVWGLKPKYVEIHTNEVDGREKKVRFRRGR